MDRAAAIELLRGLVAIPSLSHQEAEASAWLVAQMATGGFERAFVDAAGNAVGELGPADAAQTVVLLGHIDTVPGDIPVRIEATPAGDALYGRGSVDAKGPLATFVAAAARLGGAWAHAHNLRLVVVGAVEEEAASSKGARFIRDRFNGVGEPEPVACIIGEPSGWNRITLGYKGRLLVEMEASQPMAHTADRTRAWRWWPWISGTGSATTPRASTLAATKPSSNFSRACAVSPPSPTMPCAITWLQARASDCRSILTPRASPKSCAAGRERVGERESGRAEEREREQEQARESRLRVISPGIPAALTVAGASMRIALRFSSYEPAWRGDRSNALVRSFLQGLREVAPEEKLGFVLKTGTSDMNVVGPAWRCPVVAYGPGDSSLDHTPHEHVLLDEYWRAVLVLEQTLRTLGQVVSRT